MVYRGKPSKGCSRCRQKKTKCDQVEPACGQCTRYGFECPGYRSQLDLMFLDESSSVGEKAQKVYAAKESLKVNEEEDKIVARKKLFFSQLGDLSPLETFSAGKLDPFQTLAVEMKPEIQTFFHSSDTIAVLKSEPDLIALGSPTPLRTVWLPTIMSDPLVFHSMLYHSAGSIVQRSGGNDSMYGRQLLEYESTLFAMLNERFEDPERRVTEQTLITVLLIAVQSIVRNEASAHLHMNGLSRMVEIGGGLAKIPIPAVLGEAIIWTHLIYAFTFSRSPDPNIYLPPSPPHFNSLPLIIYLLKPPVLSFLGAGFKCLPVDGQWKVFNAAVHELRCQAVISDLAYQHGRRAEEASLLGERLGFLEEQLLRLSESGLDTRMGNKEEGEMNMNMNMDNILQACRLAVLIFLRCCLSHYNPKPSPQMYELLALDMQTLLSKQGISWEASGFEKLKVWILFMGVVVSKRTNLETWFEREFVYTTKTMGLNGEQEVKEVLATYLWLENGCDAVFRELCIEIPEDR